MKTLNKTGYILLGAAMVLIGGSVATAGALSNPLVSDLSSSIISQLDSSTVSTSSAIVVVSASSVPALIVSSAPKESGVSKMESTITDNTSSTPSLSSAISSYPTLKVKEPDKYGIINPQTGAPVWPGDANYEAYKAELGGDAGTVPPSNSTAVQAALEKIKNTSSYFIPPQPKIGDQTPNP